MIVDMKSRRPKGRGPGPALKPRQDVQFMSKAAALANLEAMQHHNALMAMALSLLLRERGPFTFTRERGVNSEPEKLRFSVNDFGVQAMWDGTPAPAEDSGEPPAPA